MQKVVILILALLVSATSVAAQEAHPVGVVKTVSGEAFIQREGQLIVARPGASLSLGDVLSTGPAGSIGIILRDDTVLSLGPSSQTGIEKFVYEPAQGNFAMVLRVSRGLIDYLSGKISKLKPGAVRIETPVATLGIRGTHLLARIEP